MYSTYVEYSYMKISSKTSILNECIENVMLGDRVTGVAWANPANEEVADVGRSAVEADDVAEVPAKALDLCTALHVPEAARAVARRGEHLRFETWIPSFRAIWD